MVTCYVQQAVKETGHFSYCQRISEKQNLGGTYEKDIIRHFGNRTHGNHAGGLRF